MIASDAAICNDETRFHLNGVYFERDGSKARMVSTDGHRLSKVERPIANGVAGLALVFWRLGSFGRWRHAPEAAEDAAQDAEPAAGA